MIMYVKFIVKLSLVYLFILTAQRFAHYEKAKLADYPISKSI